MGEKAKVPEYYTKLTTLTQIPLNSIGRFANYVNMVHSDDLYVSMQKNPEEGAVHKIDIFEGEIIIAVKDDDVHYKFIPNAQFKKTVKDTITNEKSLLTTSLEDKVVKMFSNRYEEII